MGRGQGGQTRKGYDLCSVAVTCRPRLPLQAHRQQESEFSPRSLSLEFPVDLDRLLRSSGLFQNQQRSQKVPSSAPAWLENKCGQGEARTAPEFGLFPA